MQEKARNAEAGRRVEARCAGCTAVAALLYGTTLVVANAGDCRALLCSGGAPVQLTRDHSAECDEERQRIIAFGTTAPLYLSLGSCRSLAHLWWRITSRLAQWRV